MIPNPLDSVRWRRIDRAFFAGSSLLLLFALGKWSGVIGGEPEFRPLSGVYMSAALWLQTLGALVQRRYRPGYWALMAWSLVFGYLAVTAYQ